MYGNPCKIVSRYDVKSFSVSPLSRRESKSFFSNCSLISNACCSKLTNLIVFATVRKTQRSKSYLRPSMNKILLTGGAGYIGSHIAVSLRRAGYAPVILDNLSNSEMAVSDGISRITGFDEQIHEIDCRDSDAILDLIEKEGGISGI